MYSTAFAESTPVRGRCSTSATSSFSRRIAARKARSPIRPAATSSASSRRRRSKRPRSMGTTEASGSARPATMLEVASSSNRSPLICARRRDDLWTYLPVTGAEAQHGHPPSTAPTTASAASQHGPSRTARPTGRGPGRARDEPPADSGYRRSGRARSRRAVRGRPIQLRGCCPAALRRPSRTPRAEPSIPADSRRPSPLPRRHAPPSRYGADRHACHHRALR